MWLTRDDDNTLSLHLNFPNRTIVNGYMSFWSSDMINLPEKMFPEVIIGCPVRVELNIKTDVWS